MFPAEVPGGTGDGNGDEPRPHDLDPDNERLDSPRDGLEEPRVPAVIGGEDGQVRAVRLSFPPPHAAPDTVPPGNGIAGDNAISAENGGGRGNGNTPDGRGGDYGPVRAPEDEHPGGEIGGTPRRGDGHAVSPLGQRTSAGRV
ncbi:hypothetical protein Amsp01_074040 [Amycolatopsis sp. NBRC 101858]|nr:hypothetical protein Amsp01_074040 [Amycolatopsis sp. NBRC 101858]